MKCLLIIISMFALSGCSTGIKYSEDTIHLNKTQFKRVFSGKDMKQVLKQINVKDLLEKQA